MTDGAVSGNSTVRSGGGIGNSYDSYSTLTDSTVSGNTAGGSGGGIASSLGGALTLMNCTISSNTATTGRGGGINKHSGILTLVDSIVSDNSAGGCGGGLANDESGSLLTNTTVSGNTAGCGGGLFNWDGSLRLINSMVSGNSGSSGGGLCNREYGELFLTNSTVSGNVAGGKGGGIFTWGRYTILEVTQSTISRNTAATQGGGIQGIGGIGSRYLGSIKLARSVIAGNTAPAGSEINNEGDTKVTVNNFNLFGADGAAGIVGFLPKPKDIVPAAGILLSDILASLADNGGPTLTHALVTGSPAIDAAGPHCPPPENDQRGVARPQQAACDIGAFELERGSSEICNNCIDDDGNGRIDLLDESCAAKSLAMLKGTLRFTSDPTEDTVSLQSKFSSVGVSLDPLTEGATVSFVQQGALLACVQLPAGAGWGVSDRGDKWSFLEKQGNERQEALSVQCPPAQSVCTLKAEVRDVQLGNAVASEITTMVVIGDDNLVKTQTWEAKGREKKLTTK